MIEDQEQRPLLRNLERDEAESTLEELSEAAAEQVKGGGILLLKYGGRLGEAQDRNGSP